MRFLTLPVILLLTACAVAAPPEWYHKRQYREYTADFGFVGVGSGATREAAIDAANADIARQISVSVEAMLEGVTQSISTGDREIINAQYKSAVKTVSNATLKGVQTVQAAEDGGLFYALCYLDRDEYAAMIIIDIRDRVSAIEKVYEDTDALLSSGKPFNAIETLLTTTEQAAECDAQRALYNVISAQTLPEFYILIGPSLQSKIRLIASNLKIEKISGDNQSAPRGSRLPQPLVVRVVYSGEVILPLEGISVQANFSDGTTGEKSVTNNDGYATINATALGEYSGSVTVFIVPPRVHPIVSQALRESIVQFDYRVEATPSHDFAVKVVSETGVRLAEVERAVSRMVTEAGHNVTSDARLKLAGVVRVRDRKKVDGLAGTQYIVKIELTLVLEDDRGSKLATINRSAQGVAKSSESAAIEDGYKKISIPPDEFAKTLISIQNKL